MHVSCCQQASRTLVAVICTCTYICMFTDLLRRRVCAVWTKLKLNLCVETVEYIHMEIRQIHKAYVVYEDVKALKILATYHQILFPAEPAKTSISNPTSII